ncbi:MAG TPA: hypothetical protein DCS93_15900 [Microscillaceae bacterium]|nr:hypothetical protein [Microscillaceae bacterium]
MTQRSFITGDHWLYYKIYTGPKTSDLILTQVIKPLAELLANNQVISQWFFIRYADPHHHLRLRFYLPNPTKDIGEVIQQLYATLGVYLEEDLIWKIQIDTYDREIERYGANTMALAETLFYHESSMIVQFLEYLEALQDEELRWLFAIKATDALLDGFRLDLPQKKTLMENLSFSYGQEFNMAKPLKRQLDKQYRESRKKIEDFMEFVPEQNPDFQFIIDLLNQRQEDSKPLIEQILMHHQEGTLQKDLGNLLSSFIHMLMNRLFKSKNRLNEMVCYNFLARYYKTVYAKQQNVLT